MDDRGEKIVSLARAVLHSGCANNDDFPSHVQKRAIPLKTLYLTALLTAVGSSAVTTWANENHRPISHYEMVEIDALVFYTARQNMRDEESIRQEVKADLNIPDLKTLTVREYLNVRDYLRDRIR